MRGRGLLACIMHSFQFLMDYPIADVSYDVYPSFLSDLARRLEMSMILR